MLLRKNEAFRSLRTGLRLTLEPLLHFRWPRISAPRVLTEMNLEPEACLDVVAS